MPSQLCTAGCEGSQNSLSELCLHSWPFGLSLTPGLFGPNAHSLSVMSLMVGRLRARE